MTHALLAATSSCITAFILLPVVDSGGTHIGLFFLAIFSGLAASILGVNKREDK